MHLNYRFGQSETVYCVKRAQDVSFRTIPNLNAAAVSFDNQLMRAPLPQNKPQQNKKQSRLFTNYNAISSAVFTHMRKYSKN